MRIGHQVTAEERDVLSKACGRALRIGEALTVEDVEKARKGAAKGTATAKRRVPRKKKKPIVVPVDDE